MAGTSIKIHADLSEVKSLIPKLRKIADLIEKELGPLVLHGYKVCASCEHRQLNADKSLWICEVSRGIIGTVGHSCGDWKLHQRKV